MVKEEERFRDIFKKKYFYWMFGVFVIILLVVAITSSEFIIDLELLSYIFITSFLYAVAYSILVKDISEEYLTIFNWGFWFVLGVSWIINLWAGDESTFLEILVNIFLIWIIASVLWIIINFFRKKKIFL